MTAHESDCWSMAEAPVAVAAAAAAESGGHQSYAWPAGGRETGEVILCQKDSHLQLESGQ